LCHEIIWQHQLSCNYDSATRTLWYKLAQKYCLAYNIFKLSHFSC
jgi:hypothetical protein